MDQSRLRAPDLYGRTHQMDEATLAVMAERLEGRGRHPFFLAAIGEYMDRHCQFAGLQGARHRAAVRR